MRRVTDENALKGLFTTVIKSSDTNQHENIHLFLPTGNRPYFGEVTNNVRSMFVDFSEDVEDKRLDVKVKCLVVEEELC